MLINNLLFCDRGLHYYNFIIHVLMRDERRKEERSKQGQLQTKNKAKQHSTPKAVTCISCVVAANEQKDKPIL